MHCLLGRRSTRLTESKLPLYKAVLKLIWAYGSGFIHWHQFVIISIQLFRLRP
jgi:hypothetical protein